MTAFRTTLLRATGQKVDSFNLHKLPSVLGKINRGDWRFHDPNTLPQRMTSLSLLACSYAFTSEMYSDFAIGVQFRSRGRNAGQSVHQAGYL